MTLNELKESMINQNVNGIFYESEMKDGRKIIVTGGKAAAVVLMEQLYSKDLYCIGILHSIEEAIEFVENHKNGIKQPDNVFKAPLNKNQSDVKIEFEEIIPNELYQEVQAKLKK